MTTETNTLAIREYTRLSEVTGFSSAQINLIRQTVVPQDASIVELCYYLYNARRLDLEPTLDQIYAIRYKRGDPIEIVVGIGGYRKQADDSGAFAGTDPPVFEYKDVGQPDGAPSKATVTVWKIVQGVRCSWTAEARWEEFYPGEGPIGTQYRKRPHHQLAIRAESHALRMAFPYQSSRLVPQPAPQVWVEAAQADQHALESPERVARNAEMYDRTIGAADWGESPPQRGGVTVPAVEDDTPADAPPTAGALVTSKTHPLWKRWLINEQQARMANLDIDTSTVKLGQITDVSLEASCAQLEGMLAEQPAQQTVMEGAF